MYFLWRPVNYSCPEFCKYGTLLHISWFNINYCSLHAFLGRLKARNGVRQHAIVIAGNSRSLSRYSLQRRRRQPPGLAGPDFRLLHQRQLPASGRILGQIPIYREANALVTYTRPACMRALPLRYLKSTLVSFITRTQYLF